MNNEIRHKLNSLIMEQSVKYKRKAYKYQADAKGFTHFFSLNNMADNRFKVWCTPLIVRNVFYTVLTRPNKR